MFFCCELDEFDTQQNFDRFLEDFSKQDEFDTVSEQIVIEKLKNQIRRVFIHILLLQLLLFFFFVS